MRIFGQQVRIWLSTARVGWRIPNYEVPGRTVGAAKEKSDDNAAGYDLYIKFADVRIDYDDYYLYASIHFIDPKTNSEYGVIPTRAYYGNAWGFVNYLRAALDEVNLKLSVEIAGELPKKRK